MKTCMWQRAHNKAQRAECLPGLSACKHFASASAFVFSIIIKAQSGDWESEKCLCVWCLWMHVLFIQGIYLHLENGIFFFFFFACMSLLPLTGLYVPVMTDDNYSCSHSKLTNYQINRVFRIDKSSFLKQIFPSCDDSSFSNVKMQILGNKDQKLKWICRWLSNNHSFPL